MSGPGNGAKAAELEKSLGDEMVDDVIEDVPLELQVKDAEKGEKDKAQNAPVLGPPPNGGLDAWLPVVGSFFMHFIVIGSVYTWGVFQRFYLADNTFPGTTSTMYALVGSFGSFTGFGSGPIVGAISTKLGNRTTAGIGAILFALNFIAASYAVEYWTILLTQGILFGFCGMLAWIPAVSPPAQWFSTKRGLAMGICVSGAGFGGLALGPLTQLMLDKLGWRWALRIWGIGGGIVCAICASLLKMRVNPPGQIDLFAWFKGKKNAVAPVATGPKPPLIDVSLFKAYKFNILFLACFWAFFGVNLPYYFVPQFATSVIHVTPATASVVLGVMNGVSSAGRILLGIISDRFGAQNMLVVSSGIVVLDVFALWIPSAQGGIGVLFVFGIIYGFFAGALLSMVPTVLASTFGVENFGAKMGLLYVAFSPGGLAGPPLAGLTLDKTHSYVPMQIMCGGLWALAGLTALWLRITSGRDLDRKEAEAASDPNAPVPHGKTKGKILGRIRVM